LIDPALEAYVEGIERHLSRHRGRECVLSPPDFELVRGWHASRMSLSTVLAGIDDAVAAGRSPATLSQCRSFVEALGRPGRD
jgi:hypothetical protein